MQHSNSTVPDVSHNLTKPQKCGYCKLCPPFVGTLNSQSHGNSPPWKMGDCPSVVSSGWTKGC